jgi:hypothetical protein
VFSLLYERDSWFEPILAIVLKRLKLAFQLRLLVGTSNASNFRRPPSLTHYFLSLSTCQFRRLERKSIRLPPLDADDVQPTTYAQRSDLDWTDRQELNLG